MSEADLDMEGELERVYSQPKASPAVSIASDDDTDSAQLDGKYDLEHDPDVQICIADDVDAPDGGDLDGDVDMRRDGDDEEEDDEEEEDEEEEDKDEEGEEEEEDEDEDEDDGKEPQMITQGEMVNTSADDVDTTVDDQPMVLSQQGHEMREHTPQPQPPAPAPRLKPLSLAHDNERWRLIPSVRWRLWDLWLHKNNAQRREVCKKLMQPETPRIRMWISSCPANQQATTVSPFSLSPMSLTLMSLSLTCTQMPL